jgi:hypothetical protein
MLDEIYYNAKTLGRFIRWFIHCQYQYENAERIQRRTRKSAARWNLDGALLVALFLFVRNLARTQKTTTLWIRFLEFLRTQRRVDSGLSGPLGQMGRGSARVFRWNLATWAGNPVV